MLAVGMRLFVSVDLPSELSDAVADAQAYFADTGLRLTEPTQAHITLKFLGDTDPDRISEINEGVETAVAESGVGSFECEIGGLGVFPSAESISVVWAGIRNESATELTRLATAIEAQLTSRGFAAANHEFTPHLTLGRVDGEAGSTLRELVAESDPTVGTFQVRSVRLKKSELTDDGPQHATVEEHKL